MAGYIIPLDTGWMLKEESGENVKSWIPVSKVPSNVHIDLLENEIILDPYLEFNELKCQWVAESSWTYKVQLPSIHPVPPESKVVLAMDGLDTIATVYLNEKVIHQSDNMFLSHRIDVTNALVGSGNNVLKIQFDSAFQKARELREKYSEHAWLCWNGDPSRLAVRKAQYHWGWDWGPILAPCGPWRPVRLEIFQTRVVDIRVDYNLSESLDVVSGSIEAFIEGSHGKAVRFSMYKDEQLLFQEDQPINSEGITQVKFSLRKPSLWFPHGYGEQSMYLFSASIESTDKDPFVVSKKIGFRKTELVQKLDDLGKSFFFKVNHTDVFCGGANWIPADCFIPRISPEKYRKWLEIARDGNQIMTRVWGGGIYEEDIFYDICDELGILVWQDFMFGCGNYPVFPSILDSIRGEAVANVQRLRHHACLAVFAGNNEDYQLQESNNLTYDYKDKDPENWLRTNFPARYIYEQILPEIMKSKAPHIAYHPGSPWGDGLKTSNPRVGDMHQWNVWHGTQEKYQIFDSLGGRFNSEFGMEAFPHIETIKAYCNDKTQLYPQSHVLDFHNKADGHERRLATYVVENFRTLTDLEGHIHLTQLVQAEALMFGYRGWRKQWGQDRKCGGALVWQLNDCWPVTSWSIVDYYLRKKPAYYSIRRVLAPVAIAIRRDHWDWSVAHARAPASLQWECWVASKEPEAIDGLVELRFISINTGREIKEAVIKSVQITPNGTTTVLNGTIDEGSEEPHVIAARLWIENSVVSRDCDWPQPFKYLDFKDREVHVQWNGQDTIQVSALKPTKGLVFEERVNVTLEDSAIDVVPGDTQSIRVQGLRPEDPPLRWRYLGME